jgi:hypothetical protein
MERSTEELWLIGRLIFIALYELLNAKFSYYRKSQYTIITAILVTTFKGHNLNCYQINSIA